MILQEMLIGGLFGVVIGGFIGFIIGMETAARW